MNKKAKWILGGIAFLAVLVFLSGFIYFNFFYHFDLFKKGLIKKVNLAGWEKLEKGMTKARVVELLGKSDCGFGPDSGSIGDKKFIVPETWEYNWSVGLSLLGEVHPKAYIVRFDSEGKLTSWREPIEKESKPEQIASP
jgi:hypothetical protein